jgi:hypothetical protein
MIGRAPRRPALALGALLWAFALGAAAAQAPAAWSVQTVAVRDLRLANGIASDLVRLGFDAYTEFAMSDAGEQWVRVRVGCFYGRADADAFARLLRERYVREAVPVPWSGGASRVPCLQRDVGFVAPDGWRQQAPGLPSFEVEVAGVRGLVRYRNGAWQVLQAPATEASLPLESDVGRFEASTDAGVPFVLERGAAGLRFVCAGELLAQTEDAAIVELDGVVSACRWATEGPP